MPTHPARIILVRHGETFWNADGRMQGALDTELNDTGKAQAEAAAAWFSKHHSSGSKHPVAAVYTSDLRRAADTAATIACSLGLTMVLDPRLRETNLGVWQGSTWDEVVVKFREQVHAWKSDPSYTMPEGESVRCRFHRVVCCLHEVALRHPGQTVVVVSHGGVIDDVGRLAQGVPFRNSTFLRKPNTCVCVLEFCVDSDKLGDCSPQPDAGPVGAVSSAFPSPHCIDPADASTRLGSWRILEWGKLDHLTDAGLCIAVKEHRHTIGAPLTEDMALAAANDGTIVQQRQPQVSSPVAEVCHDDVSNMLLSDSRQGEQDVSPAAAVAAVSTSPTGRALLDSEPLSTGETPVVAQQ